MAMGATRLGTTDNRKVEHALEQFLKSTAAYRQT